MGLPDYVATAECVLIRYQWFDRHVEMQNCFAVRLSDKFVHGPMTEEQVLRQLELPPSGLSWKTPSTADKFSASLFVVFVLAFLVAIALLVALTAVVSDTWNRFRSRYDVFR